MAEVIFNAEQGTGEVDLTPGLKAEQGTGEVLFSRALEYDPLSVRGLVRFWLADTDCVVFSNDEIDMFLFLAEYPGDPAGPYRAAGDTQINLSIIDPSLCPYRYTDVYNWYGFWDRVYFHNTSIVTWNIRLYVFIAAAFGWEAAANSAALLARIKKTATFETDTWTTAKAITLRATAIRKLAMAEAPPIVLQTQERHRHHPIW